MRARVMKLHREGRGREADVQSGRTNALLGVSGRQEERASATLSSNGAATTRRRRVFIPFSTLSGAASCGSGTACTCDDDEKEASDAKSIQTDKKRAWPSLPHLVIVSHRFVRHNSGVGNKGIRKQRSGVEGGAIKIDYFIKLSSGFGVVDSPKEGGKKEDARW